MAVYFDPNESEDVDLLRADVQSHSELARVAAAAEADVIQEYRVHTRSGVYVRDDAFEEAENIYILLDGYADDAANADGYDADRSAWTGFAAAMRRTIAPVVEHRLRYRDDDPTITSERRGRRQIDRDSQTLNTNWPPRWRRPLEPYDLRVEPFHI